ncbi:MAG TPA: NADP-dependent phosphogluconate dehydrogenase [Candidatus Atribacteria bacterium]|nr:NADP-dependent phosphogluconate dehydrogenase [Candidatus Atribacteria bacterium]
MEGFCDIGIVGLAVMGQNLALNMARKGFKVAVFNRTASRTRDFLETRVKDESIFPAYEVEEFLSLLASPRRVMLMVKAGQPVDDFIQLFAPHLSSGDLIMDGGNSYYRDTDRRIKEAESKGFLYLGVGISGGEYGALHGPSIMPGGHREGYFLVKDILEKAAAQVEDGPCCTYLGPSSAGHFVKMVHNGIEYAFMQSIAECYHLLREVERLSPPSIGQIFEEWNKGDDLNSYLVGITAQVLQYLDPDTGKPLVDLILDQAEQKGTGKWASQVALDLGIPTPVINQSVIARNLSSFKEERKKISALFSEEKIEKSDVLSPQLEKALFLSELAAFCEGFHMLQEASSEFSYNFNLSEIARIWKGGCILQARLLSQIQEALREEPDLLFTSPLFWEKVKDCLPYLRQVCTLALQREIPVPALCASLSYFDSWKREWLPANLIQAQRDFFGAHTYRRIDREGVFHTIWQKEENK